MKKKIFLDGPRAPRPTILKKRWGSGDENGGTLDTRVNPDTIGCVWTGEFDLNTLRVDGDFFESGKKNLRIQKYPDTCGRGLTK